MTSTAPDRILRILLISLMILVAIPLLLGLSWLVRGSLEMFPTEEQQDKARTAAAMVIGCSLLAEGLLWSVLRTVRR